MNWHRLPFLRDVLHEHYTPADFADDALAALPFFAGLLALAFTLGLCG
tara:strand:+ start:82 stop:225 length:144 start_codon:yes stop_codon:yes gene_type:complete